MATVAILGGSLFFMMPRSDVALAPVMAAGADGAAPVRSVPLDKKDVAVDTAEVAPDQVDATVAGTPPAVEPVATATAATVPAAKVAKAVDIPRKDDPRWARTEARHGSAALEAMRKLIVEKAAQVEESDSGLLAYAGGEGGSDFSGSDAAMRRPMQIVLPAELPEQPESSTRTASVNAPVNMRKGPGSKHGVMMVIPRRAKVEVYDCDLWCKVGYEGRTGYIYKSFVAGRSS